MLGQWIPPPPNSICTYNYFLSSQQQADIASANWTLSLSLRMVQSDLNGGTFVNFNTGSGNFGLMFGITIGHPGILINGSLTPALVLSSAGFAYNTYQLAYDAASDSASLWVNGVERLQNIKGGLPTQTALFDLQWGINQHPQEDVQANWSLVSLTIVPEPSSMAFCLTGGILAAHRFLRRRNATTAAKPPATRSTWCRSAARNPA